MESLRAGCWASKLHPVEEGEWGDTGMLSFLTGQKPFLKLLLWDCSCWKAKCDQKAVKSLHWMLFVEGGLQINGWVKRGGISRKRLLRGKLGNSGNLNCPLKRRSWQWEWSDKTDTLLEWGSCRLWDKLNRHRRDCKEVWEKCKKLGKNQNGAHRQIWEYSLEKVSKFKGVSLIRTDMDRES